MDCPKDVVPDHPCSRCEMPFVSTDIKAVILLRQRCKERGALPEAGGLLDQSEVLMSYFDRIDHLAVEYQQREKESAEMRIRGKALINSHG